jgi:hypothetical protein
MSQIVAGQLVLFLDEHDNALKFIGENPSQHMVEDLINFLKYDLGSWQLILKFMKLCAAIVLFKFIHLHVVDFRLFFNLI